jgi:zinc D-Ala-D-Ala carboxypeptidase
MTKTSIPEEAILAMHQELNIPETYPETCGLAFQPDCQVLVETESDVFGRQPFMDEAALSAWQTMQEKAREQGIELQIISAYRSAHYQKELLEKKLASGQSIEDILKVNAAPGYSEHHSGCAIDITTPGFEPLEEIFENSPAYQWLCSNAGIFGFSLSFPRKNSAGMAFEPWHWKYSSK